MGHCKVQNVFQPSSTHWQHNRANKQPPYPDLFMYNYILRGYSISNDPKKAYSIFNNLTAKKGILLDQFSFITILKACSRELAIFNGQTIHGLALRSGHLFFINVQNTLLHFYSVLWKNFYDHKLFGENPGMNDVVSSFLEQFDGWVLKG